MRLIRAFPRKTRATPNDPLAFIGGPTLFAEADEIHISVTFTWDIPEAERLEKEWRHIGPTKIGGPAMGTKGEEFIPGLYVKPGYVITSRGCPNNCWFCSVWRRDGKIRELPITEGWNVLDDNLLACSKNHIRSVFSMLSIQCHRAEFTGGIEAAKMEPWIAASLKLLKPKSIFFSYDTPDDLEPLIRAGKMMRHIGFKRTSHVLRCYVLIGVPGDNFERAEQRIRQAVMAGFFPMAMLWRDQSGKVDHSWKRFQRQWVRPTIVAIKIKEVSDAEPK